MPNKAAHPVVHTIPHSLPHAVASAAGRKAINGYVKQYKMLTGRWSTPSRFDLRAKVLFKTLTGHVEIQEGQIYMRIDDVPPMFRKHINTAINAIEEAVKDHLNKAKLEA